jgi:uncharacterized protein YoaH (UPF0181 family)
MSWWSRLTNVFAAGRLERELDEELQFHRDERIRELMAGGLSFEAATRTVARRFGNPLLLREESRDVKLFPWLDSMVRDVRQGIRALGKHGAVTGASVLSLALALGRCPSVSLSGSSISRFRPTTPSGRRAIPSTIRCFSASVTRRGSTPRSLR